MTGVYHITCAPGLSSAKGSFPVCGACCRDAGSNQLNACFTVGTACLLHTEGAVTVATS